MIPSVSSNIPFFIWLCESIEVDRWVTVFAGRRQRDLLQILPKHGDFLRSSRVRGQMHRFAMFWHWHRSGEIVLGETGKSRWPDCSKLSEHSAFHGWIPKKTSWFCIFAISRASSSTSPRGAKGHQECLQQFATTGLKMIHMTHLSIYP